MSAAQKNTALIEGATIVSSSPRKIPAKKAPGMEPNPPTTTTISARNPKLAPAVG